MARERKERESAKGPAGEPAPAELDAPRYAAAVAELEQILASIDRDEIGVDELSEKVERAVALLHLCRDRLRATELRVTAVLKDLADESAGPAEEEVKAAGGPPSDEAAPGDVAAGEGGAGGSRRARRARDDEELRF